MVAPSESVLFDGILRWARVGGMVCLGWAGGWGGGDGWAQASERDPALTFEEHVRPILKAQCFDCHGEGETLKGGLDTRLRRLLVEGGDSGSAIVPGKPAESLLLERVESGEMPKRPVKLKAGEINLIRRWIAQGARTKRDEPVKPPSGMLISEEDRNHWAFRPLAEVSVPPARGRDGVRTPVDAFVAAGLRERGLGLSPEADRATLIRRLYLGLLGIPPTLGEVSAFAEDRGADAYERLVDRLLDSPRHGERWAQHWLDVAGYADSDGYTNDDTERPHAYRYRDYVIRALNEDRAFDRFLTEQLAGDELALTRGTNLSAAAGDPLGRELLVATGFLRTAADGTGSGGVNQEMARNQVVADTVRIVSTSLLGLSVGCAQCHDHRYDPIPQSDFYRLRALLEPAYDWKQWRTPAQRLVSLYTEAERAKAAEVEAEAARLSKEREGRQKLLLAEALEKHLEKFEESLRGPLREAQQTAADKRTPEQKELLAGNPSVNIHPGVLYQYNPKAADELKKLDAEIAGVRERRPKEEFVQALTENPGGLPVTHRFHRGDPQQPREAVGPGGLTVLSRTGRAVEFPAATAGGPTTGRRLAFARWLTGPENPLTARVWVNRVWMHHFGRGLVETPADFGTQGGRPTHPELLDWLARVWIAPVGEVGHGDAAGMGWSLKRLHRLIVTSAVYRQSSGVKADGLARDPENRWYWRKPLQRLDAEALRDSMLAVSGQLNGKMFGPAVPVRENAFGEIVVGEDKKQGDNKMPVEGSIGDEAYRRSVYVQMRRSKPLSFLNAFDAPVMEVNCERRQASTVAPQALMLMNGVFVIEQGEAFAARLEAECGGADGSNGLERPDGSDRTAASGLDRKVDRAWRLAFGRGATAAELAGALGFLSRQTGQLRESAVVAANAAPVEDPKGGKKPEAKSGRKALAPERQALANLCQALLSANEFLYLD